MAENGLLAIPSICSFIHPKLRQIALTKSRVYDLLLSSVQPFQDESMVYWSEVRSFRSYRPAKAVRTNSREEPLCSENGRGVIALSYQPFPIFQSIVYKIHAVLQNDHRGKIVMFLPLN